MQVEPLAFEGEEAFEQCFFGGKDSEQQKIVCRGVVAKVSQQGAFAGVKHGVGEVGGAGFE